MDGGDTGVELKKPYENVTLLNFLMILQTLQDHWLGSFILNLLGYALIIVPSALLIRRWKNDPGVKAGVLIIELRSPRIPQTKSL